MKLKMPESNKRARIFMLILVSVILQTLFIWKSGVLNPTAGSIYFMDFAAYVLLLMGLGIGFLGNRELESSQPNRIANQDGEKRYEMIVRALPDVVLRMNSTGTVLEWESGENSWFHGEKSMYIGKRVLDVLPLFIAEECVKSIQKTLQTNTIQLHEFHLRDDEEIQYHEARYIKIHEEEVLCVLRNITEYKKNYLFVEYLSYHDPVTGLYNRRFFEEEMKRLNTERNLPLTIVVADVNGLKLTNDAFGHLVGDELIQKVGEILKREFRGDDIVARMGGDEFMILLPKTTGECAELIIQRIQSAVANEDSDQVLLSIAFGSGTKTQKEEDINQILTNAEEKMYRNKLVESPIIRDQMVQRVYERLNNKMRIEGIHSEKVSSISREIGIALELDAQTLNTLEVIGLMHDIGKVSIKNEILDKPGPLTDCEFENIKKHSESGYQILKPAEAYAYLAEYVLYHHERWDGNGYPVGLQGEEIPLLSRIITVADSFEAMTSDRTYRTAMSEEEAFEELKRNAGSQFDPQIVDKFIQYKNRHL